MRADGAGKLIPDLATAVPSVANGGISRDGRTVTYHLRRGVRWHDGTPFDARDVVFSFAAAMNPNNAGARPHRLRPRRRRARARSVHGAGAPHATVLAVRRVVLHDGGERSVSAAARPSAGAASPTSTATRTTRRRSGLGRTSSRRGTAARGSCWPPTRTTSAARRRSRASRSRSCPTSTPSRRCGKRGSLDFVIGRVQARAHVPGRAAHARATRTSCCSRTTSSITCCSTSRTRRSTTRACAARSRWGSIARASCATSTASCG